MPLSREINKILILGAGANIVNKVSDFDILCHQAIQALCEDNVQIILINPNPATIQTDTCKNIHVFLEPLTTDFVKRIIRMEKPDAILTAFGGTPAIELVKKLQKDGIIQDMNIKLLTINDLCLKIKDAQFLYDFLSENKIPVADQWLLHSVSDLSNVLKNAQYPLLITKSVKYRTDKVCSVNNFGMVKDYFQQEAESNRFNLKNYRINEDLSSWEELIFDVIRDNTGNCCFINSMSSLEPVSVNSHDSILIAPILTHNNNQIQELRHCCSKIANLLNINGILTIHFAVKKEGDSFIYKVLSVKPRLTHTSLISYRINIYSVGYVIAKIAIGYNLNEIIDPQSGLNSAIEPINDAFAIKMPYWSFTELSSNYYELGNKSTSSGLALGIGRNFETALMKAIQSTTNIMQNKRIYFNTLNNASDDEIINKLQHVDNHHLLMLIVAISKGISLSDIQLHTGINCIFLQKIAHIVNVGKKFKQNPEQVNNLIAAKKCGFSNKLLSMIANIDENLIDELLDKHNIKPSYIGIDGTAGLHAPKINAYYSGYEVENEIIPLSQQDKCLIIGLKSFQISQTGEFDYMIYHVAQTLKKHKMQTVIISNNPESISNSYDLCDRVYFEPITLENILYICKKENIKYLITQFSGKQINQYRQRLLAHGLKLLGQDNLSDVLQQDRKQQIINANVNPVPALITTNRNEVLSFIETYKFPVLIGGFKNDKKQKSAVVFDKPALNRYIDENDLDKISISQFIEGNKYEITTISDGKNVTIPGIIEHFEQTGSHASDSIAVFRPQNLTSNKQRLIRDAVVNIAQQIHLRGPINLHILLANEQIYVLQIKTYAGHNVAFLSKSLQQDISAISTEVLLGKNLDELGLANDVWPSNNLIYIKMPVFSYLSYNSVNTFDSKMKTSGSVMGRANRLSFALYKGYEASNLTIPSYGTVFISVKDSDKKSAISVAARFHKLGFQLLATEGTANILAEEGITTSIVEKLQTGNNSLLEKIAQHKINLVINVTNLSDSASHDAIMIKDQALNTHIPVFSSIQSAENILNVLETMAMCTQPL